MMILVPTDRRNWVVGKLWQIQKEANECQVFGSTACEWHELLYANSLFCTRSWAKQYDDEKGKERCEIQEPWAPLVLTLATYIFLFSCTERSKITQNFNISCCIQGRPANLLGWLSMFLWILLFPSWDWCFFLMSTSIRHPCSCQVKANRKGTDFPNCSQVFWGLGENSYLLFNTLGLYIGEVTCPERGLGDNSKLWLITDWGCPRMKA